MFWNGNETLQVPRELHSTNRIRLCEQLKELDNIPKNSVILLKGGDTTYKYDTDTENMFVQESYFHWAFGVLESGFWGLIEIENSKATLFAPRLPQSYEIWMGKILTLKDYKDKYLVDSVSYLEEMILVLATMKPSTIFTLKGYNTDSQRLMEPPTCPGLENFTMDTKLLHPIITECRVFKTPQEMEVIKYVAKVTCEGHKEVMRRINAGMMEYELEGIFRNYVLSRGGCRLMAYNPICACGPSSATLHYGTGENGWLRLEAGNVFLMDAGGSYCGYASDVTTTCPVPTRQSMAACCDIYDDLTTDDIMTRAKSSNVRFFERDNLETSNLKKCVYESVLRANRSVVKMAKPNVTWLEMHLLAERVILEGLKGAGLLKGQIDGMMNSRLGAIFMPHGVGHFLGIDVHDVGGYPEGEKRSEEPGISALRTKRILQTGMVLTVEPGCYFIEPLLKKALSDEKLSKFLVEAKLDFLKNFGGVRIEDEIYIDKDCAVLLTDYLPRTILEIEHFMTSSRDNEGD
ncbi:unnamed protein product [Gordionus sp. m RMFG-2023]|uniref:xaa-Pro dipeptidase-like n=1 Tax=Gordionus sp. m RMFG-2023 TaxID=3053472 RepID=UPI0030E2CFC5